MKILHVLAQLPSRTGSGVYYSNVIEELAKYPYEQGAVFASQDDYEFDILNRDRQYPVFFKSPQIPFPIAGMSDVMPYKNTLYSQMDGRMIDVWQKAFTHTLEQAKSEFAPDIVLLHHLWMLSSLAAEVFERQIKIGICHNTDIRQAEQHPEMKNKYVTNIKELDEIFSLSNSQKQKISDTFGVSQSRIITIGGGFNKNLFYPSPAKKQAKKIGIVYAAKIEKSKGVFELVKAFQKLSAIKPNLHLDIIGCPNEENARLLSSLTASSKNIALVPISNQKNLAAFIRDKDIFVMPSYFEGLGLMAIESLASGLRVVASEIEGLMLLLGDAVNNSGVIEYVKLPRIYDTDKPYEQDLDQFVEDLFLKLLRQIERVEAGEDFPPEILLEINKHSWDGIAEKINDEILKLAR